MTLLRIVRTVASAVKSFPNNVLSLPVASSRTFATSYAMANCVREIEGDLFSAPKDHLGYECRHDRDSVKESDRSNH